MRVVQLRAENFKRLQTVEITPEGSVVKVGGKNGSGKSSVLDAIYVALVGRAANPPKPVRAGEEKCLIKLDLGDLIVTRTFTVKESGTYTDTLKVENADGLRYASNPQKVLDALLGEIGFDPFEFVQMKAADQADTLLRMVPLPVDLDELAEQDQSDFAKRRDINRDAVSIKSQFEAIPAEDVPSDLPDRDSLVETLGKASETNTAIERDRLARERTASSIEVIQNQAEMARQSADRLRREAAEQDALAKQRDDEAAAILKEYEALPPLAQPVDAAAIQQQLREAEATLAAVERQQRRARLGAQLKELQGQSETLTNAMAERERQRQDALTKADMPIKGLAFALDEKGRPTVQFNGVPFEQASTAEQLRASTAIAMASNPQLRVLRVKDGSLLDDDSMKLLAEMAAAEDFQLWIEVVGTDGGVGIIMEDGTVKGAATVPEEGTAGGTTEERPTAKPKGGKAKDGGQLL
jgi:DNA repair exonuclease SbcCD ATPase subunit